MAIHTSCAVHLNMAPAEAEASSALTNFHSDVTDLELGDA